MYTRVMFWWRTTTQVVIGSVIAWLIARGFDISPEARTAVEAALFGVGVSVYAAVVHFLETVKGDGALAKAARGIAKLLMLGAPAKVRYVKSERESVEA
jgi:hypothetical protein